MFRQLIQIILVTLLTIYHPLTSAEDLPTPTGRVLLTVSGNIDNQNVDNTVQLDRQMLENLPATSFKTMTPWTKGVNEFTGVRVSELLDYVGAGSNSFRAHALDKYWNDVTDIDFDSIPVIIAYMKNGKELRVRELGPLWIMFPFDAYPDISDEKHKTASVWQLIKIVIN